jgi:hypothetical protein
VPALEAAGYKWRPARSEAGRLKLTNVAAAHLARRKRSFPND